MASAGSEMFSGPALLPLFVPPEFAESRPEDGSDACRVRYSTSATPRLSAWRSGVRTNRDCPEAWSAGMSATPCTNSCAGPSAAGGSYSDVALLHGSEVRTEPPSPEQKSHHSVAVGHPQTDHRIEDLARQLYFNALPSEGSTSHASTDNRLVPVDSILDHAALAVPRPLVPPAATELVDGLDVPVSLLQCGRRPWSQLSPSSRWDEHPHGLSLAL